MKINKGKTQSYTYLLHQIFDWLKSDFLNNLLSNLLHYIVDNQLSSFVLIHIICVYLVLIKPKIKRKLKIWIFSIWIFSDKNQYRIISSPKWFSNILNSCDARNKRLASFKVRITRAFSKPYSIVPEVNMKLK